MAKGILYHKHHIIPKHMGGTNDPSNILKVNIPLHAFLHKLLWEENQLIEDKISWLALSGQITKAEAHLMIVSQPKSEITKLRMSESKKGQPSPWKGKKHSDETRRKMSDAKKGYIPWNKGKKGSQVPWNKGLKNPIKITEETRMKLSISAKKDWEKRKRAKELSTLAYGG